MESSLKVTFHPDSYPLGWETSGQLAEFISHYTGLFFEASSGNVPEGPDRAEIEDAINYIMLELVQNALKFNTEGEIAVTIELHDGAIVFTVSNQVHTDNVTTVETTFHELLSGDPAEMLLQRIEENAAKTDDYSSGIGFLTIMNYYGAEVSWRFDESHHYKQKRLTVMTKFPLQRSNT